MDWFPIQFLFLIVFILQSCNLAPPTPELRQTPEEVIDTAKVEALKEAAFIADDWIDHTWWQLFNDPQLTSLIERAIAQNPSIDIAEARIGNAIALCGKTFAPIYPNLHFSADTMRVHESVNSVFGILHERDPTYPITYRQNDMALGFSYSFDFMRKHHNQIAAALNEVEAMKAEAYLAQLSVSLNVAQAYFQWQIDQNRLHIAEDAIENRKALIDLMDRKLQQGLDSYNSLYRVENDLLQAEQFLYKIQQDFVLAKNELEFLIAENFSTEIEEVTVGILYQFPIPSTLELDLLAHRPDVWAHRWRVEAAAREIAAARADFYPNVDIKGLIGLQALNSRQFLSWDSVAGIVIGPAIHLPIFDGGLIRANYDYRWKHYHIAVAQFDKSVLTATKEVLNALAGIKLADEYYMRALELENNAKSRFDLSQLQVRQKVSSRIDLLTSNDHFLQVKDNRMQALQKALQARLDLIYALGGGFGICME